LKLTKHEIMALRSASHSLRSMGTADTDRIAGVLEDMRMYESRPEEPDGSRLMDDLDRYVRAFYTFSNTLKRWEGDSLVHSGEEFRKLRELASRVRDNRVEEESETSGPGCQDARISALEARLDRLESPIGWRAEHD